MESKEQEEKQHIEEKKDVNEEYSETDTDDESSTDEENNNVSSSSDNKKNHIINDIEKYKLLKKYMKLDTIEEKKIYLDTLSLDIKIMIREIILLMFISLHDKDEISSETIEDKEKKILIFKDDLKLLNQEIYKK